jgi:NAD(P)-dependent dehydrogenase (short-subunit alcohol dehydrogenase family)
MALITSEELAQLWPASPLKDRVALVTGCGRTNGIGGGCVRVLAAAGAAVVATDVEPAGARGDYLEPELEAHASYGLPALVADLRASGAEADFVTGDVTSEADAQRMVGHAIETFGKLDILVNVAAAPHGREWGEIDDVAVADWDRVMAVAGRGTFLMTRAAVPGMREQRWGRIINISSVAGKAGRRHNFTYSASKAALLGFTRSLALDVAPFGITVNAICPGPINTSRLRSQSRRAGIEDPEARIAARGKDLPVGRLGEPEDIGRLCAFLSSDLASFITARDINVDGGEEPSS